MFDYCRADADRESRVSVDYTNYLSKNGVCNIYNIFLGFPKRLVVGWYVGTRPVPQRFSMYQPVYQPLISS